MFEKENDERRIFSGKMMFSGREFQRDPSDRGKRRYVPVRVVKRSVVRANQPILQDGEVRHQNQLTGETFSRRMQVLRDSMLHWRGERKPLTTCIKTWDDRSAVDTAAAGASEGSGQIDQLLHQAQQRKRGTDRRATCGAAFYNSSRQRSLYQQHQQQRISVRRDSERQRNSSRRGRPTRVRQQQQHHQQHQQDQQRHTYSNASNNSMPDQASARQQQPRAAAGGAATGAAATGAATGAAAAAAAAWQQQQWVEGSDSYSGSRHNSGIQQ
jgi:hypothetical protein